VTPELWSIFIRLQTEMAYDGVVWSRDAEAIVASQPFYRMLLGRCVQNPRTLVIGPGGLNEVEALQRAGADVVAVTAHPPEALYLRDHAVRCMTADVHDLPFQSGWFDFVYAANVMEHAFAPYIALMESRRVVRLGGRVFFLFPSFEGREGGTGPFHLHCLDVTVWGELLRKTGHQVDETWDCRSTTPISVQALLSRHPDGSFAERTGCAWYVGYVCTAVVPPSPHDRVLSALVDYRQ